MRIGKVLEGFFWGSLVGAGFVLLFAPYSGEETQQRLQEWVQGIRTAGEEAAEQKRLELTAQLEELKRA